jgi:hypothetical protein
MAWSELALIALALAACGDNEPALRTIDGTWQTSFRGADGMELAVVPVDLSTMAIGAAVFGGGTWRMVAGVGRADGTLRIDDVPDGVTWFEHATSFDPLAGKTIAILSRRLGRPDQVSAGDATTLAIDAAGLVPWVDGDDVLLLAPSVGVVDRVSIDPAAALPAPGATALHTTIHGAHVPLLESGDALELDQLARVSTPGGAALTTIAGRLVAPPTTIADGDAATLTGLSFAPVAQDQSRRVVFPMPSWAVFAAEVSARAQISAGTVRIAAFPDWIAYGVTAAGGAPELATLVVPPGSFGEDETIHFGDPLDPRWDRFVRADLVFTAGAIRGSIGRETSLPAIADGASLEPLVSPPLQVRIDGVPADRDLAGVGVTPTLSWDAPTLGAPDDYVMTILAGTTPIATITTIDPQLTIPAGLLTSGTPVVFVITARQASAGDRGWADTISGTMIP